MTYNTVKQSINRKIKLLDGSVVDAYTPEEKIEQLLTRYESLDESYNIISRMYNEKLKCSMCIHVKSQAGHEVPTDPCNACSNGRYHKGNNFASRFVKA